MIKLKLLILVFLARWWIVLLIICLMPVYAWVSVNNERNVDYVNNGFFTFWLSGHMQWSGEQPYSSSDWVNGHHINGATWIPNQIFPYPLPLALITAPLGLLPISQAYLLWDFIAQLAIAACILWLATRWEGLNRQLFAVVVLVGTIVNGNILLGLMTGTISAIFLVFLTLSLYLMEHRRPYLAGILLAGLAFKPPLLIIAALLGIWFLFQRNWKAILGIFSGGLGILLVGFLQDIHWLEKFRAAGENLLSMRLGNQPTLLSYSRYFCSGNLTCAFSAYLLLALLLVGIYTLVLWRNKNTITPIKAYTAAISLGVLLPPYIWSYDYALLIIPICYISFELIRRRESYIPSTLFMILLDILSMICLALFWLSPESSAISIQRDMWSIWVALLVLLTAYPLLLNDDLFTIQKKLPEIHTDSS